MKKTENSIRAYILTEPREVQAVLRKMHAIVKKAAPGAGEKLAWGMPTLTLEGNLIHFAAFNHHLSLFPGSEAMAHFKKDLTGYTTSKGTVQFQYEDGLPAGLITRIVKYCVKQNLARAKFRAKKTKTKK